VLTELEEMCDDAVFLSRGRTVVPDAAPGARADGRRTFHVRALSLPALVAWLDAAGAAWRPDEPWTTPPTSAGGVLVDVAGDEGAAALIRDAVAAGVPLTSVAPAVGALERAYLTLEEDRR
jgi:hypothetical protein